MHHRRFNKWNFLKKKTDKNVDIPYFHPREIWFVKLGENIGYEQNGKGKDFLRPVIILKKFNKRVFWGLPLTTVIKTGKYYYPVNNSAGKKATAILSQIRLIDAKLLNYKIGNIEQCEFIKLKKAISRILLSNDDF